MIKAILFDLDGTLVDTALDMGAALNNLLIEENYATLPLETIRPLVSQGALALTLLGFAAYVEEDQIEALRQRYLQHYRAIVADQSRLFDGFEEILSSLKRHNIPWGIVTNKPQWLTTPLLEALGLSESAAVVISGDTLAQKKPHPLPLIVAAKQIGIGCESCLYLGDDERDIIAGRAAHMKTLIAGYGYIRSGEDTSRWRADGIIQHPVELLNHTLFSAQQ